MSNTSRVSTGITRRVAAIIVSVSSYRGRSVTLGTYVIVSGRRLGPAGAPYVVCISLVSARVTVSVTAVYVNVVGFTLRCSAGQTCIPVLGCVA